MNSLPDYTASLERLQRRRSFVLGGITKALASAQGRNPVEMAEERMGPRSPYVIALKSATGAMVAGVVPELSPFGDAFIEEVNRGGAFGGIEFQRVPFYTRVAIETTSDVEAADVTEGGPIPVVPFPTDITQLTPRKKAIIATFTKELAEAVSVAATAERLLVGKVAAGTDRAAFDPNTAGSLTEVATELTPTGNMTDDVKTLLGSISSGVYVRPFLVLGTGAARALPDEDFKDVALVGRGAYRGVPTFVSPSSALSQYIIAVDGAAVIVADGGVEIVPAQQAAVVLDDAPGGGPQQLTSFWQTNLIGLRAIRYLAWAKRADGVAYLTVQGGSVL